MDRILAMIYKIQVQEQIPEVAQWKDILHNDCGGNVTQISHKNNVSTVRCLKCHREIFVDYSKDDPLKSFHVLQIKEIDTDKLEPAFKLKPHS